jgi:hypothetical protein
VADAPGPAPAAKRYPLDSALVTFIYVLMRDHLPTGVVADIVKNHATRLAVEFSNKHLAEYARELAEALVPEARRG